MKRRRPRPHTLSLLALTLLLQCLAPWAEARHRGATAVGEHGVAAGAHRAQARSHRPAPQHRAHHPAPQARSPRLPSGFGSAANVPPGFYQRLNAPQGHHRHPHGTTVVPVYVYLEPSYSTQPFYSAEPGIDPRQVPAPAPAPTPAPQPIYIVAPPAAAPAAPAPVAEPAPLPPPVPRRVEPGEVRFSVQPADAEVFLDDEYLGTGAELALAEAQLYPAGVHVLEVTHPDYRPQRLVFGVGGDGPTHVLIDLSIDRIGRRSRIK